MITEKKFSSKILLFGEYTVIRSGTALAIPFPGFSCCLDKAPVPHPSNNTLKELIKYLRSNKPKIGANLDIDLLQEEVHKGLIIKSNIPQGYGAGSSGAVVASLFYQFKNKNQILVLDQLKTVLAEIESFFHGSSSGVDPLVTLLNQPLWLHGKCGIEMIDNIENKSLQHFYLLDSLSPRMSSTLIQYFLKMIDDPKNKQRINHLTALVSDTIENFISAQQPGLLASQIREISELQYHNFRPMIIEDVLPIWYNGLNNGQYSIKLSGAGGGGFYLIYSRQPKEKIAEWCQPFPVIPIVNP